MIEFERNTLAIVISDVHIGNDSCRIDEFIIFLENIIQNLINRNLRNLKALIILGDFFDLNATSFEDLCSNHQYFHIYNKLNEIKNQEIEIILVLGNHEVSTSLFYNLQFSGRKKRFLKRLEYFSFPHNFLNRQNVCQYLILISIDNNIYLALIDSIHKDPFAWFHLGNGSFLNNETYFMCHGFQFEDKDTHHLITGWWDYGRNLSEGCKKYLSSKWSKFKASIEKRDKSRFYKNIKTALEEDNVFSHIIFGHTHDCEIKETRILNTGCWLKDSNPSYLEIFNDGSCELYELNYE